MDKVFDTLQQRYDKVRNSCNSFQILQYGICTFRYDNASESFIATPISAYLFPRSNGASNCFMVQPSSVEFLAGHHFDFNKSFLEGLGFLSKEDENRMKQGRDSIERDPVTLSEADKEYLEKNVL